MSGRSPLSTIDNPSANEGRAARTARHAAATLSSVLCNSGRSGRYTTIDIERPSVSERGSRVKFIYWERRVLSTTLDRFWAAKIAEFAEIYAVRQVGLPFVTAHITHPTRNMPVNAGKVRKIKHLDDFELCLSLGDSKVAPPRRPSVTFAHSVEAGLGRTFYRAIQFDSAPLTLLYASKAD